MRPIATTFAAAAALAVATPALAQNTTVDPAAADPAMSTAVPVEDDDDDFPWGLLGLLGLAGLLGRKRDDRPYDNNPRT